MRSTTILRRKVAVIASALMLLFAIGGASTASAAGPNYLEPGWWANYPSWVWGHTRVCAYNYGPEWSAVTVWYRPGGTIPAYWRQGDRFGVDAYTTACRYYWFGGDEIAAENSGANPISTYTQ